MGISPDISILMPAYNSGKYIKYAISSILDQNFKNWELLIGNDCSTDGTLEIIQSFALSDSRIKIFNHPKNLGYLLNVNYLWERACGKYITFQDSDDWSDSCRLEIQHTFLIKNQDISICSINYYRVDENAVVTSEVLTNEKIPLEKQVENFIFNEGEFPIFPNGLFFKKEIAQKIGYYNEFFSRKCGEDWDWILRAYQYYKIIIIPKTLYYYRDNSASVTQTLTIDKLINKSLIASIYQTLYIKKVNLLDSKFKEELIKLENSLKAPFLEDKSLLFFELTCNNLYHKQVKSALKNILTAIRYSPFKLKYYKSLKFILSRIIRQSITPNVGKN